MTEAVAVGHQTVFRRPTVIAGVAVALVMALTGIFAPVLATHDPNAADPGTHFTPPGGFADGGPVHVLGTDHLGRDVLSRIVTSFRTNLYIGLLGSLLGTLAAWLLVVARSIRGTAPTPGSSAPLFGLPFYGLAILTYVAGVFLSILVMSAVGVALMHIVVSVGVFSAILPMALVSESARRDDASSGPIRLAVRGGITLFPVTFSLALLMGLFIEFSLSFLGVGVPPDIPSLGNMVAWGTPFAIGWSVWVFPLGAVLVGLGAFSAIVIPVGRGLTPPARVVLPAWAGAPAGFRIRMAAYLIDLAAIILFIPPLLCPLRHDEPAIRICRSHSGYSGSRGPGRDSGGLARQTRSWPACPETGRLRGRVGPEALPLPGADAFGADSSSSAS